MRWLWIEAADDLLPHALGRVIATVGGLTWPPSGAKLLRLAAWLRGGQGRGRSLGGVLIERSRGDVRFVREPRAVAAASVVRSGGIVWDGRFRIDGARSDGPLEVAMAGVGWRARLAGRWPGPVDGRSTPPAKAVETLPLVGDAACPVMLGPWLVGWRAASASGTLSAASQARRCGVLPIVNGLGCLATVMPYVLWCLQGEFRLPIATDCCTIDIKEHEASS